MIEFHVWDAYNTSENSALLVEADSSLEAVKKFVSQDSSGQQDGLYLSEDGGAMIDVRSNGMAIHVRCDDGELHKYSVGVVEFVPKFEFCLVGTEM